MTPTILEAYHKRIHFSKTIHPNLEGLKLLVMHHTRHIPFENLNPLLNIPVELDMDSVYEKLIFGKRGGYCFEQNLLFKEILNYHGFQVAPLAARVTVSKESPMNARTHMLLIATIGNNEFLVDVGFGGMTPTAPLLLKLHTAQKTPHNTYRILEENSEFILQYLKEDAWQSLYEFDFQPQYQVDFKIANWFTSTHPDSHFRHRLSVAIAGDGFRKNLLNNRLNTLYTSGKTETQILSSGSEIREILQTTFYLNLCNLPGLDRRLQALITL